MRTAIGLFVIANMALTLVLAGMVVARKLRRDAREITSAQHRSEFRAALLGSGDGLDRLLRSAARRTDLQSDLARILPLIIEGVDDQAAGKLIGAVRSCGLQADLQRRLASRRPATRGRAALLMGLLGLNDAASLVRPLLADPDPDVRLVAAGALARIGTGEAATALIDALGGDMVPERLIERLGGTWAVPSILARLGSETEGGGVRASLARALGFAGDPSGEAGLLPLLASVDDEERICAARSLGTCGSTACHDALLGALGDPEWEVRAQAALSLGSLGVIRAVPLLESNLAHQAWWVRANAASALAELGPDGLAALTRAAEGDDAYAAERAVEVLAVSRRRRLSADAPGAA